jgi:hypothetical protein
MSKQLLQLDWMTPMQKQYAGLMNATVAGTGLKRGLLLMRVKLL